MDQVQALGPRHAPKPPRGMGPGGPDATGGGAGRRRLLRAVLVVGVGFAVLVGLWTLDSHSTRGEVGRHVTLAGQSIAGLKRPALDDAVARLADRYRGAEVVVNAPDGGFSATADELGLSVVSERTASDALKVGRTGNPAARFVGWVRSFVAERKAPVRITVDQKAMARIVAERDPKRTPPQEPTVMVKDDKVVAKPGVPGKGISAPSVLAALEKAGPEGLPLRISVARDTVPTRFSLDDAQRLAEQAERISAGGLPVSAGPATATVPASVVRGWFRTAATEEELKLTVDASDAPDALKDLFPKPAVAPVDAGFTVANGKVSVTPAKAGSGCCGPGAAAAIQSSLLTRGPADPAVSLPLATVAPSRDDDAARKLAIIEPIGTFTTNHAAGEPRVQNIHRIADIIRGAVIAPGATFSINDFVGQRTTAKGFVDAPVIDEHYNFASDIGGGISQFTTTIFNAAFFSGLDIPSYFMHGIYISRYPYGRESTISYPGPDVRIRNNTPYGVLIWPTYTDTSITVTMYSTKYVSGEQTNQTTTPKGPCTAVTTERTRTYVDGRKTVDNFYGLYSPMEGVECP